MIWRVIAKADSRYGDNPEPARDAGIKAAAAALAINPRYSNALENQANFYLDRANDQLEQEQPGAAAQSLEEADSLLSQAIEINPKAASFRRNRADTRRLRALAALGTGENPQPWSIGVVEDLQQADAIRPGHRTAQAIRLHLLLDRVEGGDGSKSRLLAEFDQRLTALEANHPLPGTLEKLRTRRDELPD